MCALFTFRCPLIISDSDSEYLILNMRSLPAEVNELHCHTSLTLTEYQHRAQSSLFFTDKPHFRYQRDEQMIPKLEPKHIPSQIDIP